MKGLDKMSLSNLDNIGQAIGQINEQIKALTEEKKRLEKDLRPQILNKGVIVIGEYTFECVTTQGRVTLDKARLAADFGDLSAYEKVGAPSTRLTIKKSVPVTE